MDDSGNGTVLCQSGQAKIADWLYQKTPVVRSTEVPLIFDATWATAWPKELDATPKTLYGDVGTPFTLGISNNLGSRVCVARHRMAINVGFLDGHVQTVQLPELWTLRWHNGWSLDAPQTGPTGWSRGFGSGGPGNTASSGSRGTNR